MAKLDNPDRFWTSEAGDDGDLDTVTLVMAARSMIVARRALQGSLPIDFLHDPALDILLALFVAATEGRAATPAAIAAATTIAPGVAHRWIAVLAQDGLVVAGADMIALTATGQERVAMAIRAVIRSQVGLHAAP